MSQLLKTKGKLIGTNWFARPALTVAPELLGKVLVRQLATKTWRYRITEVEAYCGVTDLACHASRGKTKRTEVMFGPAGRIYVYLIYGMYHCLNLVTAGAGEAWEDLVADTVARGLYGLENLSLIPGTVGAAPIQNINAYGAQASDTIDSVTVFDTESMSIRTLSREECKFEYRDSLFKKKKQKNEVRVSLIHSPSKKCNLKN